MKRNNIYTVQNRRKRKGKTHYQKRLKLLVSRRLRLVVRKSLRNTIAQVIEFDSKGDKVLVSSDSKELKKLGYKMNTGNVPSAYLTGLILGKKAKKKKIEGLILDIGLNKSIKGCQIFACLKGVIDAGIKIPHSEDILPPEDRINGLHISKYAELLSKYPERFEKQFKGYKKEGLDLNKIGEHFKEIQRKIVEE